MLLEIVTGSHPFRRPEDSHYNRFHRLTLMQNRLVSADYVFPTGVSDDFRSLIMGILKPKPSERLSVKEIFKHPWFKTGLARGSFLINNMLIQESRQEPPSQEEVETIRAMVQAARTSEAESTGPRLLPGRTQSTVDMDTFLSR